jgi:hypothetical protein
MIAPAYGQCCRLRVQEASRTFVDQAIDGSPAGTHSRVTKKADFDGLRFLRAGRSGELLSSAATTNAGSCPTSLSQ